VIALSSATAAAIALHAAEGSWVLFLQAVSPAGRGPIKIEGIDGKQLASRLTALARDNAFEVQLIGLLPSTTPIQLAQQIILDFAQAHLHDGWFEPTSYVLTFVEHAAQEPLQQLLAQTHPGGLEEPVDIEEMAKLLDVSVVTVRRLIKAEQIPYMKLGRVYRFVPADVIASLQHNDES
jgi:excisionase family DNA binding protein